MIIEQFTDPAGRIRIRWQLADGNHIWWKFTSQPTLQQLQDLEANHITKTQFNTTGRISFDFDENKEFIIKIVTQIKNNPSLTLTQYNNYLATLPWYEAAFIRYFIYWFGVGLSKRAEVSLGGVTETQFLTAVRNYIVAAPPRKLGKLIFGDDNVIS